MHRGASKEQNSRERQFQQDGYSLEQTDGHPEGRLETSPYADEDHSEMGVTDCRSHVFRTSSEAFQTFSKSSEDSPKIESKFQHQNSKNKSLKASGKIEVIDDSASCLQMRIQDASKKIEYMTMLKDQYSDDITPEEKEEFERSIEHYEKLIKEWKDKLNTGRAKEAPRTPIGSQKLSSASTPCTCTSSKQLSPQLTEDRSFKKIDCLVGKLEDLFGLDRLKANLETRLTILLGEATTKLGKNQKEELNLPIRTNEKQTMSVDNYLINFSESECNTDSIEDLHRGLYGKQDSKVSPWLIDKQAAELQSLTIKLNQTRGSLQESEDALMRTRELFGDITKKLQLAETLLDDLDEQVNKRKEKKEQLEEQLDSLNREVQLTTATLNEANEELELQRRLKDGLELEINSLVLFSVTLGSSLR